eukprot:gnl/Carplike_NY0171/7924_a10979_168.p1 GENE.gnl/Carplike_NY0171/7924_a10979_168~~gnl/Carplike_NY0171/7924_a10979_168.p1  ORF type:complete len:159 (+),score=16.51 gnl/Carplike_NY0171/7924_a10979_168:190-666(+)
MSPSSTFSKVDPNPHETSIEHHSNRCLLVKTTIHLCKQASKLCKNMLPMLLEVNRIIPGLNSALEWLTEYSKHPKIIYESNISSISGMEKNYLPIVDPEHPHFVDFEEFELEKVPEAPCDSVLLADYGVHMVKKRLFSIIFDKTDIVRRIKKNIGIEE